MWPLGHCVQRHWTWSKYAAWVKQNLKKICTLYKKCSHQSIFSFKGILYVDVQKIKEFLKVYCLKTKTKYFSFAPISPVYLFFLSVWHFKSNSSFFPFLIWSKIFKNCWLCKFSCGCRKLHLICNLNISCFVTDVNN